MANKKDKLPAGEVIFEVGVIVALGTPTERDIFSATWRNYRPAAKSCCSTAAGKEAVLF